MDVEFLRSLETRVMAAITGGEAVTRRLISSDDLQTMEGLISLPGDLKRCYVDEKLLPVVGSFCFVLIE